MRPDIGLGEYGAAGRGALLAQEAVERRQQDRVAIPPIGSVGVDRGEASPAAVIRGAAS
jgi:hypothetical protein